MNSQPETGNAGGGDFNEANVCWATMGLNDQLDSSPKSEGATPLDGTQHENTDMHSERMDSTQIGDGEEAVLDDHSLENSDDNANYPQAPPVHGEARRDLHNTPTELRDVYDMVKASGRYNFAYCRKRIPRSLNIDAWERYLAGYEDEHLIQYLKYGWPVGIVTSNLTLLTMPPHRSSKRCHDDGPDYEGHSTHRRHAGVHFTCIHRRLWGGGREGLLHRRRGSGDFTGHFPGLRVGRNYTQDLPPSHVMTWLGIEFITLAMTMTLPQPKNTDVHATLDGWEGRKRASLKEIQRLFGLQFVTAVAPPAGLFTNHILDAIRELEPGKTTALSWGLKRSHAWVCRCQDYGQRRFTSTALAGAGCLPVRLWGSRGKPVLWQGVPGRGQAV